MAEQTTEQAIEEIWRLFRETDAPFKESRAQFEETDAKLAQALAETQARLAKASAEVARTSAGLRKLEGLFGNPWGRLLEALVKPGVLALFQQRGHDVRRLHERSQARIDGYTNRRGLYVLSTTGDDLVQILNDDKFWPHDFGSG